MWRPDNSVRVRVRVRVVVRVGVRVELELVLVDASTPCASTISIDQMAP